jgi:hypothetical protein
MKYFSKPIAKGDSIFILCALLFNKRPLFKAQPDNTPNPLSRAHHTPRGHVSERVYPAKTQNNPELSDNHPNDLV